MGVKIDQFFASDGTLIRIPVKSDKKVAVLQRIASTLNPGVRYTEKELNLHIQQFHPDTASIRRHMIEYGILDRDSASVYWTTEAFPSS